MPRKIQKHVAVQKGSKLQKNVQLFKIAIEVKLDNGFELKDMTQEHIKQFHRFICETVYKKLSVSEVDKLFLHKKGLSNATQIKYGNIDLVHYGKDRNPFRIFGYYNTDGYFVICRIDGAHKTNEV